MSDVAQPDDGVLLDVLGILDGVDKASLPGDIRCTWDYLRHFGEAFRKYRDEEINVLELGVHKGSSLNLWLRYFSKATIVGVDINPACGNLSRGRAQVRIGSQDDREFLTEITKSHPPTIVIDDGSHIAAHIIRSFEILFPLVLPGGLYVVEDLAFHFASEDSEIVAIQPNPDVASEPVFEYFARLIAAKAAHASALKHADENRLYKTIDSITVIGGAILIKKRAPRDLNKYVEVFEEELRNRAVNGRSHYAYIAAKYAEFLVTYQYRVSRAVELLEALIAADPDNRIARKLLHKAMICMGRLEKATEVEAGLRALNDDASLPAIYIPERMQYPH